MAARAGVTLVELLIVLAILGIVATLVVPGTASVFRVGRPGGPTAAAVLDSARRLAVAREVTLRLRLRPDGHWSIGAPGAEEPLATGVLPSSSVAALDVLVDPLGSCRPAPGWQVPVADGEALFDVGRCRLVSAQPPTGRTPP